MLRTFIERASRNKTFKRHFYVNNRKIPIYVSPDAQLKYLKFGSNVFDNDLIQIAESFLEKDSIIWDIGANVGTFTFAACVIATEGAVLSVEADVWLVNLLRRTAQLKEYRNKNIYVLPAAISEINSIASFNIAARGRASNALDDAGGRSQMGGVREVQYVPTIKLDTILEKIPAPDFVKIDIEGAEFMALKGASLLIKEIRPTFYIEVGEEENSTKILNLFLNCNYSAFSLSGEKLEHNCTYNTFFIPNEKSVKKFCIQ